MDCYNLGQDDEEHSGMVRAIFEGFAGTGWKDLVTECARRLALQRKAGTRKRSAEELESSLEKMGRERRQYSDLVRAEFERICNQDWGDLVERRARQLAADLRNAEQEGAIGRVYVNLYRQKLYEMARDSPSYAARIRKIVERHARTRWVDLERAVKSSVTL
jgi:hypothetical protein